LSDLRLYPKEILAEVIYIKIFRNLENKIRKI